MTRPCRRMIRHLLQIFLTLGLTFTVLSPLNNVLALLVPVHDPAAGQVVGAELHDHAVVGQDPDVVHPHLPADMGENLVPVVQLHAEEGIRERLDNRAFDLDGAVFFGHVLRASFCLVVVRAGARLAWPGSPGSASPLRLAHARAGLTSGDEVTGRGSEGPASRSHARAPRAPATGNPAEWTGDECTRPAAPTRTDGV